MPACTTRPSARSFRVLLGVTGVCWAVLVPACRASKSVPSPAGNTATANTAVVGSIPVNVENRGARDVVIYAVRGTLRRRLGSVPGLSRVSLTVPDTFTSDAGGFSILAIAIAGGESYLSDPVAPQPGLRLALTLEPRLASSALAVVE